VAEYRRQAVDEAIAIIEASAPTSPQRERDCQTVRNMDGREGKCFVAAYRMGIRETVSGNEAKRAEIERLRATKIVTPEIAEGFEA